MSCFLHERGRRTVRVLDPPEKDLSITQLSSELRSNGRILVGLQERDSFGSRWGLLTSGVRQVLGEELGALPECLWMTADHTKAFQLGSGIV